MLDCLMCSKTLHVLILLLLCPTLQSGSERATSSATDMLLRFTRLRGCVLTCRGGSDWDTSEDSRESIHGDRGWKVSRLMEMGANREQAELLSWSPATDAAPASGLSTKIHKGTWRTLSGMPDSPPAASEPARRWIINNLEEEEEEGDGGGARPTSIMQNYNIERGRRTRATCEACSRFESLVKSFRGKPFRNVGRKKRVEKNFQLPIMTHIASMNATCVFIKKIRNLRSNCQFTLSPVGDLCRISDGSLIVGFVEGNAARVICQLIACHEHTRYYQAKMLTHERIQDDQHPQAPAQEEDGEDEETTDAWTCEVRIAGHSSVRSRSLKILRQSTVSFSTLPPLQVPSGPSGTSVVINRTSAALLNSQEALESVIDDLENVTSSVDVSLVDMAALHALGVRSSLYDHQLRGVNWMLSRECRQGEGGDEGNNSSMEGSAAREEGDREGECPEGMLNGNDGGDGGECGRRSDEEEGKANKETWRKLLRDDVEDGKSKHNRKEVISSNNHSKIDELVHSALWKKITEDDGTCYYDSVIANIRRPSRPHPVYGGILADDMGLGEYLVKSRCLVAT
ncbi:hypothetical protein GUITHDRAFT_137571 [Guillardia theta CCMP2712]|uniref:Uncharacterized protein n=1 Tax=Guillardia theta (strain CCMP2712) TaxID=905079 RepID=L1JH29_GUITC|nr:hypothetical protein GUITHDRAFT_137571 [Guillardia theta CCMP2712]EKX47400.1 hypothetical protein GUITHDRAFT_137571 [Guillardia theta CCMP2712]|eukprot:XP_005834380.1 hypothetical protein GUITHDRAFT_137571 [Guillardia theta CCMP2712]